jgi:hypothetical protein
MKHTIQVGTTLIDDEPRLTNGFGPKSEPYSDHWSVLPPFESKALDHEIHAAGWNFFFLAAEVKAMFFGAVGTQKLQSALKRILSKVRRENFNCLEVTGIVAKRFWGMPYAVVSAHARHIQQSNQLDDSEARQAARRATEWARG